MRIKAIVLSFVVIGITATTFIYHFTNNQNRYTARENAKQQSAGIMGGDEYLRQVRANVHTGEFNPNDALQALKQIPQIQYGKKSNLGLDWESMGPIDVGGRTRDFIIDNQNPDRFITGGVSGGIFVSDNKGLNWKPVEGLPNLIVSTMDQGTNGTIYVGTGSRFEGSAPMPGTGIYKSTDGENFEVLSATIPNAYELPSNSNPWPYINRLAVDPSNDDIVYAGTNLGLYRTSDGGQTWTSVFSFDCGITGSGPSSYGIDDVKILPSGRVIIGARSGVFYSDNPAASCGWTGTSSFTGNGRIALAFCQADPNYVYAITVTGGGQLDNIFKSTDGGLSWEENLPKAPTETQDPTFELFGSNGQGIYDLAIEVFPNNCENLMIGGVQLFRIQSAWARVASTFAPKQSGIYVHADKHYFKFNPNNPNQLFVASDGGIGVTNNASSAQPQFSTLNRNYVTTQFYDIDITGSGKIAGGTQDNGSIMLDPSLPSSAGREEIKLLGGDGFGTKFSTLSEDIVFTTLYYNQVTKITLPNITNQFFERQGSFDSPSPYAGVGSAPFRSVIDIWETENDTLSRDSITFTADTVEQVLATLSSSDVAFSGTVEPNQPDAKIIPGSISFRNPALNRIQTFRDVDADGILYDQIGDSVGFYNYDTRQFQFRFPNTPSEQSDLFVYYAQRFDPGDTLRLRSRTLSYLFPAPLQVALNPGDSIRVQDPVQSIFAMVYNNGVVLTREALKSSIPGDNDYIDLSIVRNISGIRTIDFSPDGNQLFAGTGNGDVWRFTGMRQLFADNSDTPENVVSVERIFQTSGPIEGLSAHPEDLDKMLVSVAGYGNSNHIFELTGINAGATAISRNVQGNMPDFPVYDALYNLNDPSQVLLGTDFGIWSTNDIDAADVVWEQENELIGRVPVFRLLQQTLPPSQANNTGIIYAGTHGRGIWKTGSLVSSVPDYTSFDKPENMDLKVYPNPASYHTNIEFTSASKDNDPVTINIYDLNGKLVRTFQNRRKEAGKNIMRINTGDLPAGNYIAAVSSGKQYSTTRFVVMR